MGTLKVLAVAPNAPQINEQTLWVAIAIGGLIVLYVLMRPRKKKDPLAGVSSFPLARQRGVEEQMNNLLVELSEMARQISAQLDTRAAKLELLIKEADERLVALRALSAEKGDSGLSDNGSAARPEASREIDSAEQAALSTARPTTVEAAPTATVDPRYADVYALADEGRSAHEIARLLGRPAGEVELILALRPKHSFTPPSESAEPR
jgi:hypothetical protein